MNEYHDLFPRGEVFESDKFSGTVFLNMLTGNDCAIPIANVTFQPGCRNNWHVHAGGQILLVTCGRGYFKAWEEPARELKAGDVVQIPAGVKHWHGAAKDSWFSHLAIEVHPQAGPVKWLEQVSDEEYGRLK